MGAFAPPPLSSHEGADPTFKPPPLSSHQGPEQPQKPEQPGFWQRFGETVISPVMGAGQYFDLISHPGAMGVAAAEAAAQNYAQHGNVPRAILSATPAAPITEDLAEGNIRGLAGTAAGTVLLGGIAHSPETSARVAGTIARGATRAAEFAKRIPPEATAAAVGTSVGYHIAGPEGAAIGGLIGERVGSRIAARTAAARPAPIEPPIPETPVGPTVEQATASPATAEAAPAAPSGRAVPAGYDVVKGWAAEQPSGVTPAMIQRRFRVPYAQALDYANNLQRDGFTVSRTPIGELPARPQPVPAEPAVTPEAPEPAVTPPVTPQAAEPVAIQPDPVKQAQAFRDAVDAMRARRGLPPLQRPAETPATAPETPQAAPQTPAPVPETAKAAPEIPPAAPETAQAAPEAPTPTPQPVIEPTQANNPGPAYTDMFRKAGWTAQNVQDILHNDQAWNKIAGGEGAPVDPSGKPFEPPTPIERLEILARMRQAEAAAGTSTAWPPREPTAPETPTATPPASEATAQPQVDTAIVEPEITAFTPAEKPQYVPPQRAGIADKFAKFLLEHDYTPDGIEAMKKNEPEKYQNLLNNLGPVHKPKYKPSADTMASTLERMRALRGETPAIDVRQAIKQAVGVETPEATPPKAAPAETVQAEPEEQSISSAPDSESVIAQATKNIERYVKESGRDLARNNLHTNPDLPYLKGFDDLQRTLDTLDQRAPEMTLQQWKDETYLEPPLNIQRWGSATERPLTRQEAAMINRASENRPGLGPSVEAGDLPSNRQADLFREDRGGRRFWMQERIAEHRRLVEQALKEGRPVSPEVLADYPDLQPKPPKKARRTTAAAAQ